ncbi:aconitate hydratase [Streptomyces sp. WMMB 322]|uniref:aconitate hydratase n=1 Tax=Streptomyces sp. WMMB 322 TaxID=1286821 RepID=UPI000823A643|nr:aconitate hydratase [Streptomyces sp. WMMB 322]SCK08352.1 aconitase [Streptomyces sp. WMMB 322]
MAGADEEALTTVTGRAARGTVTQRLIDGHLAEGEARPGEEIGLRIDQTLTQDATGTLVMQELESLGLDRVRTEVSVQYVDHDILRTDGRNAEDHAFLRSAARRFGLWYSKPGNGVSHPTHMQRFGVPGKTLAGSDSHTCAAGSLGMLAIGVGGLEVALAMAGRPLYVRMPRIWGVRLTGELPPWVSAKDVILELLRRHGVKGAVNRVLEYHGPGLASLSAMDRHVIAGMGAELGATASVFPSDDAVRDFLRSQGREEDFVPLAAEPGAVYDLDEEIDLSSLEPLIARPSSPGSVVSVREVAGRPVDQAVIGSCANPGLRDFAVSAAMVAGRRTAEGVSLDVNPTSREILQDLTRSGGTLDLVSAGARLHQSGCLGCTGMGRAPAVGSNSLRTFPRNFPGRSGAEEDSVWLCSPETAVASALTGVITDPRDWAADAGMAAPRIELPEPAAVNRQLLEAPLPVDDAAPVELERGPNVSALPEFDPLPETLEGPVLLKAGDDVSTDEISPAGARALPYRSDIPKLAEFTFARLDPDYPRRAAEAAGQESGNGHFVVGGDNYGQGSSREHAAITPRHLGLRAVVAKSFARIHWQNLVNFGVLPLEFEDCGDGERISSGDVLRLDGLRDALGEDADVTGGTLRLRNVTRDEAYAVRHRLSARQRDVVRAGGVIPALAASTAESAHMVSAAESASGAESAHTADTAESDTAGADTVGTGR